MSDISVAVASGQSAILAALDFAPYIQFAIIVGLATIAYAFVMSLFKHASDAISETNADIEKSEKHKQQSEMSDYDADYSAKPKSHSSEYPQSEKSKKYEEGF